MQQHDERPLRKGDALRINDRPRRRNDDVPEHHSSPQEYPFVKWLMIPALAQLS